ncbi:MAG: hypothetical protein R3C11_28685 [Planctomycetaceae bacterium]
MHQLVQRLSEARLQLALQGDQTEAESLYADADFLMERNPKSKATMEASWAVVRFANTNAMRYSQKNTGGLLSSLDVLVPSVMLSRKNRPKHFRCCWQQEKAANATT